MPARRCYAALAACLALLLAASSHSEPPLGESPRPTRIDFNGDPLPEGALARLGTVRFRQGEPILALAFSPDGQVLATAGVSGSIRLWDARTGRERRRLKGHQGPVSFLAFSADGQILVSQSRGSEGLRLGDGTVRFWDVATGKEQQRIEAPARGGLAVHAARDDGVLSYERDGDKLLIRGPGSKRQLRVSRGPASTTLADQDPLPTLSPDGRMLATAEADQTIRLWDTTRGAELHRLRGHECFARAGGRDWALTCAMTALAFSPDGKTLVSTSHDGSVRLWDVSARKELHRLEAHVGQPAGVAFAPDGKLLACADGTRVRLWEVASGRQRPSLSDSQGAEAVAFSPDGMLLASAGTGGTVRLWHTGTGKELRLTQGHTSSALLATFSADGRAVVSVGSDRTRLVWDPATGRLMRSQSGLPEGARVAVVSGDRRLFALGGVENEVSLRQVATGKAMGKLTSWQGWSASTLAFSGDGKRLAWGTAYQSILLRVVSTGEELHWWNTDGSSRSHWVGRPCVALSPDGSLIATAGDSDGPDGTTWPIRLRAPNLVSRSALPQGRQDDGEVRHLKGHTGGVSCLAFGARGLLASGGSDGLVRLWQAATGAELAQLAGHKDNVSAIAFAPDGQRLASGGRDGTVRLWDVTTGKELRRFTPQAGPVDGVAFAPDGRALLSWGEDTTVLVWDLSPASTRPIPPRLETLWADLGSADLGRVSRAITALIDDPDKAVPFLHTKLLATAALDREIARHIDSLGSASFARRQRAMRELERVAPWAEPALREALTKAPSPEAQRRLGQLLRHVEDCEEPLSAGEAQPLRALDVLARLATPEAQRVLATLAEGPPAAWLTREARAALGHARQETAKAR
ncbi:MAG: WD40 repeat domain-containing protein [Gemmataceae bacterium]|nr:WD40 repeat domain-containing protein [Gemmataceae bacterium]